MTSVQELFAIITAATSAKVMPTVIANLEAATDNNQVVTELHYEYGHQKELTATINRWAQDNILQNKNMPLIWLREDISFGLTSGGRRQVVIPSIVIAYITQIEWTSKQREQYTFEPVLRPIYFDLLRQISRDPNFVVYDPHTDIALLLNAYLACAYLTLRYRAMVLPFLSLPCFHCSLSIALNSGLVSSITSPASVCISNVFIRLCTSL